MTPIAKVAGDLDVFSRDCAVTVALKIADDSCKMDEEQRTVFVDLYNALSPYESAIFDKDIHELITQVRLSPTPILLERVKQEREIAMTIITQEKMKLFKASVRGSLLIAQHTA